MGKISFWQSLLGDVGYYEREAINSNHEGLSMMMQAQASQSQHVGSQLRKLYELDHAQSKELAQLRTIVRVLSETIIDMGFDKERLEQRMEAALDDLESEKTMVEGAGVGGGPYRGGPVADAPQEAMPEPTTVCTHCTNTVLVRRTTITEHGNVCDRCHYR
ncbi:MAG: hypothetical protein KJO07_15910 [Deltaproteobacteria bacterium]|nr:hypothetical protein [Deltaproteobacteria bacterium]